MTFLPLVPDGWIKEYLLEMEASRNEMPIPFHFLSACVTIGQMMGLDTWATLARGVRVFPNVNAMLLSPAGKCRRGEGTKIAMSIAKGAGVNVLAGRTTPEALIIELMNRSDTLLYAEELSMLLTKQDYQRSIIPVLTKLLLHGDGEVEILTIGRGKQRIPRVNLSALFTSAPDWFMQTIPEEAFGGGMMSRFLVCCLDKRDVMHIDIQADDVKGLEAQEKLAHRLSRIEMPQGHMRGTDEASAWITDWYIKNETDAVADERCLPHRNRKPANLLRLAMILAAASGETRITKDLLLCALEILDYLEPTMIKLFGITDSVIGGVRKGEKRVLVKLAKYDHVKHSVLARSCAAYFEDGMRGMRRCLEGLTEKGLVLPLHKNGVNTGWPPLGWKICIDKEGEGYEGEAEEVEGVYTA